MILLRGLKCRFFVTYLLNDSFLLGWDSQGEAKRFFSLKFNSLLIIIALSCAVYESVKDNDHYFIESKFLKKPRGYFFCFL